MRNSKIEFLIFIFKMRRIIFSTLFIFSLSVYSQNEVIYLWSGALTHNSIKVNAKMTSTSTTIRLVVDDDISFSSPLFSPFYSVDSTTNYMVSMEMTGLNPLTNYYYCVESGGIKDTSAEDIGSFKTFANGPFSYSFATGSCTEISNHKVFDVMKSMNPNFYIVMGDLHYMNPNSNVNINMHRLPYETEVLSKQRAADFFKKTPVAYIWDDHDFCGNNSDSSFLGRQNARIAYHEYVPHYPLGFGNGANFPINQAFTVGRVHYVLTDLRSTRSSLKIMDDDQKQWFENECIYARDNGFFIAWINSSTWNNTTETGYDNWYIFNSDRVELGNFFLNDSIKNMFIISGDAHMLGIDDGANSDFSFTQNNLNKYPIFQAGAISGYGSYKGGIFNQGGPIPNPSDGTDGQFGMVNITDNGIDSICIEFKGYRVDSSGTIVQQMNNYSFCKYLTPVSIQEKNEKQEIDWVIIQPNPSNELKLVFKQNVNLKSIKIYSINGSLLLSENKINLNVDNYTINTSHLPLSNYIVEIETNKGSAKKYWQKNNVKN